jgi:arylsulfatase A-like enzyme
MAKRILFITTDMMRWDTLGYNGCEYATTPAIDKLAEEGIRYDRAYNQNPLCMPSRSTMLTGQYTRHHGSWNNGIALPHDSPTFPEVLKGAGWRTALIGKPHFEPFSSPESLESCLGIQNSFGPVRGFEWMNVASHDLIPATGHYTQWLKRNHPEYLDEYYPLLQMPKHKGDQVKMNVIKGGETGAIFVKENNIPREQYHTDWVADNTISYMDTLADSEDAFIWMSFPDPHHPYDPPASEKHFCDWKDLPYPDGFGKDDEERMKWLQDKPQHFEWWYTHEKWVSFEAVENYVYRGGMTADNVNELRAMIHISNAIIDENIAKVIQYLEDKGWLDDTDIIFTPDHGGWDGEYGLLFIGPTIADDIARLPMIWKPAKNDNVPAAVVTSPVGALDLAATFIDLAGAEIPDWVDGRPLPKSEAEAQQQRRSHVFCQYEGYTPDCGIVMNGVYADGKTLVQYMPSPTYEGTEGELYDMEKDPAQRVNFWDDPAYAGVKKDMIDLIRTELLRVPQRHPLPEPGASI